MVLGIALIVLGVLGLAAVGVVAASASSDGVLGMGWVLASDPQAAALTAAAAGVVATAACLVGLYTVVSARARKALIVRVDERAQEAERDARARLLEMRLQQLQHDVEHMEQRRSAMVGELSASADLIDGDDGDGPVVVVLEDGKEPTVLGQRLAESRRSLRA